MAMRSNHESTSLLVFFVLDLCALTASEESVSSFIVPQVRGDKDWPVL